jgi:peptide/nickel transport system permease protein
LSLFSLDGLKHIALPAINLAIYKICMQARLAKSGTQEVFFHEQRSCTPGKIPPVFLI